MQVCKRCVYNDRDIKGISFDQEGVCNFCHQHDQWETEYPIVGVAGLHSMAAKIKKEAKGSYDCVVGLSGGCDSSYLLYIAVKLGLRPIAVNLNNGWDTDIARNNIDKMCKGLGVELWTYEPDQEEYNSLWRSMITASVPDVEAVTDIALTTVLYMGAEKFNTKYILNGHSFRTEGWVPPGMSYMDGRYIWNVYKHFNGGSFKTYPNLWMSKWLWWTLIKRIKRLRPLYSLNYNKETVKKMLHDKFGWQWYGKHHCENVFTDWFANYYRIMKCGFDSRIIEFAALVRSEQMAREEALEDLKACQPDITHFNTVAVKLGWTPAYLTWLISKRLTNAEDWGTYRRTFKILKPLFWMMYKRKLVPKTFYEKYC